MSTPLILNHIIYYECVDSKLYFFHLVQKQRRQERREARQRQRKEYRQMLKERKSGLFKKEEVLSVSTSKTIASIDVDDDDDEDIEVDIL